MNTLQQRLREYGEHRSYLTTDALMLEAADRIDALEAAAEPVAWVDDLMNAQPHCVTDLKYCSAGQVERDEHLKYVPLYAAPADQSARIAELERQRDALLEACNGIVDFCYGPAEGKRPDVFARLLEKARIVALKAAGGGE